MENPVRISISQAAMKNGLIMGAYTILSYAMTALAIRVRLLSLPALALMLCTPVAAYYVQKIFRDRNCPEFFPFSMSWMLALLTTLFKSVIGALAVYAYMRYLDHGLLASTLVESFETLRPAYAEAGMKTDEIDMAGRMIESLKYITPGSFARQIFETTLFWGNLLSIVIAALTAKGSIRTFMNNNK